MPAWCIFPLVCCFVVEREKALGSILLAVPCGERTFQAAVSTYNDQLSDMCGWGRHSVMTLLIITVTVARCYGNYAEIWGDIRRWCVVNDSLVFVFAVIWWRRGVERERERERERG